VEEFRGDRLLQKGGEDRLKRGKGRCKKKEGVKRHNRKQRHRHWVGKDAYEEFRGIRHPGEGGGKHCPRAENSERKKISKGRSLLSRRICRKVRGRHVPNIVQRRTSQKENDREERTIMGLGKEDQHRREGGGERTVKINGGE